MILLIEHTPTAFQQRGWTPPRKECPVYDIKPSEGKAPGLVIWGMRNSPSLPLLTRPLWIGVVAPEQVQTMDVLHLLVPVKGFTGVHHLRARPYFSSSVLHVWLV